MINPIKHPPWEYCVGWMASNPTTVFLYESLSGDQILVSHVTEWVIPPIENCNYIGLTCGMPVDIITVRGSMAIFTLDGVITR